MCTLLLAHRADPEYPLVIAANRDELYERPTLRAAFWDDAPDVLGGRDGVAGGTWLGVHRDGRWAALTNVREPDRHDPRAPSRGALVRDFLTAPGAGARSPADYLAAVAPRAHAYNGFNLVVGRAGDELWYLSNRDDRSPRPVAPGVHGVSNAVLNTPWPKVRSGREELTRALAGPRPLEPEHLLTLLHDRRRAADDDLPRTGVPLAVERELSALFIATPRYGTRCSTVVLVDRRGRARFVERATDPTTPPHAADVRREFTLARPS